jgi:hypothetical protein
LLVLQHRVSILTLTTQSVMDALNALHDCQAGELEEGLEWPLLCSETSLLLTQVMAELLPTVEALAAWVRHFHSLSWLVPSAGNDPGCGS